MAKSNARPERVEPTQDGARLRVVWRDGHVSEYEPRYLRLACRCAGCVNEFTGEPILKPEQVPPDIYPTAINWVGRYALKFVWSDAHDTGIYPFDFLRAICTCDECRAAASGEVAGKDLD